MDQQLFGLTSLQGPRQRGSGADGSVWMSHVKLAETEMGGGTKNKQTKKPDTKTFRAKKREKVKI